MSNRSKHPGFALVRDRLPYHGKGVDELIAFMRKTLSEPANKYAQKIVFEAGSNSVYIEKLVPEGQVLDVPTLTLHEVIRIQRMEEYDQDEASDKLTGLTQIWGMYSVINKEGYEVSHIAIGDKAKFQKWVGVRIPATDMNFFGTPVTVIGDIPEDVVIVCGSKNRVAETDEILFSVKGLIP
jgi:hypothetical protein